MSLLMWRQGTDGFMILTDTLSTTPEGDPRNYQTKVWPLPHLGLVIGGTGLGQLIEAWYREVQNRMLVLDIENLDAHTPKALRRMWSELIASEDAPAGLTVTIYHFGFVERMGKHVRYTYRSVRDFASEFDDTPGVAVKPAPESGHLDRSLDSADDMIQFAHILRAEQDAKPKRERVHIGGELILTMMLEGGTIASTKVHRYDDYFDMWEEMNALMASDTPSPTAPPTNVVGQLDE